jgi:hypothetical protein
MTDADLEVDKGERILVEIARPFSGWTQLLKLATSSASR